MNYYGSKWNAAPWILSHFPEHKIYVEGFAGSAAILLNKKRSDREILNDKDDEIVNIFRMARERGSELQELLKLTPFARSEFYHSYDPTDDPLEQARRTLIKAFMGIGNSVFRKNGFRISKTSSTCTAKSWVNYADCFEEIIERLRGVLVENMDYVDLLLRYDDHSTLFYLDPPYVRETRKCTQDHYRHDFEDEEHLRFLESIKALKGMVIVSGYDHVIYDSLGPSWFKVGKEFHTQKGSFAQEVIWLNKACQKGRNQDDFFQSR
jgi:DNA adenine methylase